MLIFKAAGMQLKLEQSIAKKQIQKVVTTVFRVV
jgi:hypothetical protein